MKTTAAILAVAWVFIAGFVVGVIQGERSDRQDQTLMGYARELVNR